MSEKSEDILNIPSMLAAAYHNQDTVQAGHPVDAFSVIYSDTGEPVPSEQYTQDLDAGTVKFLSIDETRPVSVAYARAKPPMHPRIQPPGTMVQVDTSRRFVVFEDVTCPTCGGTGVHTGEGGEFPRWGAGQGGSNAQGFADAECAMCQGSGNVGAPVSLLEAMVAMGLVELRAGPHHAGGH